MLNQVVMVGRLTSDPKVEISESGKKFTNVSLAVPRSYKNADGEYETDFIDCVLFDSLSYNTTEYCKKGDLVGIKGRLQTNTYEVDGETKKKTSVVAEKVTFLSTAREREDNSTKESDNDIEI